MAKHALLSASGAHRWLECTPSAKLESQFENTPSVYAEEGTAAHSLAELVTKYWLNMISEAEYENQLDVFKAKIKYYNAEMLEYATDYAKLIQSKLAEIKKDCPDPQAELEVKVDFSAWVPQGFGTGDCIIVADETMDIIDFKYGKGHRVEATGNPQMRLYALGAYERYKDLYDIKNICMTIFQPRISGVQSSDEMTIEELLAWAEEYVKPRAALAIKGKGKFNPGAETCKFCRAKEVCRARTEHNVKLFDEAPDIFLITPEEAGEILKSANDMEAWLSDLKKLVSETLLSGAPVTGWKMVEGRSNRKITDETAAAEALKAAGYGEAEIFKRSLLTLTALEKQFGKKEVAAALEGLIIKPAGSPTLAPADDKRKEYKPDEEILKEFDKED